jgi:membrane-bound ClpP family serine protease
MQELHETEVQNNNLNPDWNEQFSSTIEDPSLPLIVKVRSPVFGRI